MTDGSATDNVLCRKNKYGSGTAKKCRIDRMTMGGLFMGSYLNPKNKSFWEAIHSEIYVDKTGLITYFDWHRQSGSNGIFGTGSTRRTYEETK